MSYKKILITGSEGFVGQHLRERLVNLGYSVKGFDFKDGDITEMLDYGESIEHVFHLAGKTFIPDSWKNPASFYKVNVLGTVNVLDYCRRKNIGLTYLNTYGYGEPESLPVGETAEIRPNTPYNHSKYVAEDIIRFYCSTFGMNAVSLRAFNIFGFGQQEIFLLPSLVRQVLDDTVDSVHVKVFEPKRDYVYIDDVVSALVSTLNAPKGFNAYNIGSGKSYSVREVGEAIMRLVGIVKPFVADGQIRPNDVPDIVADISKIRRDLGWTPTVGFEEGLRRMILQSRLGAR